jgi:hypothetical protein
MTHRFDAHAALLLVPTSTPELPPPVMVTVVVPLRCDIAVIADPSKISLCVAVFVSNALSTMMVVPVPAFVVTINHHGNPPLPAIAVAEISDAATMAQSLFMWFSRPSSR